MADADGLSVERADGVVTLQFNRPERGNGVDAAAVTALTAVLVTIRDTPADRVVVLTGAGDAFCSGIDLASARQVDELTFMRQVGELVRALHDLPQPVIAKVRGPAIGLGCSLALACDLILAAEDAVFQLVFARRGLALDGGSSWLLPRRVGIGRAKELAFFAERVGGVQALEFGLVDRVVPAEELDVVTDDWATRLADAPARALAAMKQDLNRAYERTLEESLHAEAVGQSLQFHSKEFREGIRAFKERRPPNFHDRGSPVTRSGDER